MTKLDNPQSLALAEQMIDLDFKWLKAFDVEDPFNREIYGSRTDILKMDVPKEFGYSVRCLKD